MKPSTPKPIEKVDGSWTFTRRRVADLAAAVKHNDLLYVDAAPHGSRWDARRGESPGFADLQAALALRGLQARYEQSYYWRVVTLTTTAIQPQPGVSP